MPTHRRSRRLREVQDSTDEDTDYEDTSSDSDPEDFVQTFAGLTTYQLRHGQGRADLPNDLKTIIFKDAINNGYFGKHLPSPNQLVRLCYHVRIPLDQGLRVTKACVTKLVSWITNNVTQLATSGLIMQRCTGKIGAKEQWVIHVAEVLISAVREPSFSFATSIQSGELLRQHTQRGQTYSKVQNMAEIGASALVKRTVSQLVSSITKARPVKLGTPRRQQQPSYPGQAFSQQYPIPQYSQPITPQYPIPQFSQQTTPQHPISQYSQPVTPQQGHWAGSYLPDYSSSPSGASTGLHHSAGQHSPAYTNQPLSPNSGPFHQATSSVQPATPPRGYTSHYAAPPPAAPQHGHTARHGCPSPVTPQHGLTSRHGYSSPATPQHATSQHHTHQYVTPSRAAVQQGHWSTPGASAPKPADWASPAQQPTPQPAYTTSRHIPARNMTQSTSEYPEEDQEEVRLRLSLMNCGLDEQNVDDIVRKSKAGKLGPPNPSERSPDHAAAAIPSPQNNLSHSPDTQIINNPAATPTTSCTGYQAMLEGRLHTAGDAAPSHPNMNFTRQQTTPVKMEAEAVEVSRSAAPTWPPQSNVSAVDHDHSDPALCSNAVPATGTSASQVFQCGARVPPTPAPQTASQMPPAAYEQAQSSGKGDGSATAPQATPQMPTAPHIQASASGQADGSATAPQAVHQVSTAPQIQASPTTRHDQAPPTAPHIQAAPTAPHIQDPLSAQAPGLGPGPAFQPVLTPAIRAAAQPTETSQAALAALRTAFAPSRTIQKPPGSGPLHTSQQYTADAFAGMSMTSGATTHHHPAPASTFPALAPPTPQDQMRKPSAQYTATTTLSPIHSSQYGHAAYDPSLATLGSILHHQSPTIVSAVAYDQPSLHPLYSVTRYTPLQQQPTAQDLRSPVRVMPRAPVDTRAAEVEERWG